jgi:carbonic anhydrase/acetyltransferase-like protein (isoleucine patch superfamily)
LYAVGSGVSVTPGALVVGGSVGSGVSVLLGALVFGGIVGSGVSVTPGALVVGADRFSPVYTDDVKNLFFVPSGKN